MSASAGARSTVLVTGATGFLGGAVVRALIARGHSVRALGRDPVRCAQLTALGADVHRADLRDRDAVRRACAGVDAVVHSGALSSPWGKPSDFHEINVAGTRHVLDGCAEHRVRRLVHISSPSVVFDGTDHRNLNESAPYPRRFASMYSETKKLAEDAVRASNVPAVILRPKAIFGPGDTALLPRLLRAARMGRLSVIGDGANEIDLTYVDNVVHAITLALHAPAAAGRTYTITNGEHVKLWDVVRRVLNHQGLSKELRRVPVPVAMFAASIMEARARFNGREPTLTRYSVQILARTQTYDISAAKRDLGYSPQVSVDAGLELTLKSMEAVNVA